MRRSAALLLTTTTRMASSLSLVVDPFCLRQFDANSGKTPFVATPVAEFEAKVNALFEAKGGDACLVDGYAPFCKHVFVENFAGCLGAVAEITPDNEHLLRTAYSARTPKELPVLTRWFPKEAVPPPPAKMLDLILYSREQIRKENAAMGEDSGSDAPWGIVSIKAQDEARELPMQPITVMRNALGADEGGSGVPLDADKYRESVAYWEKHAPIQ
mmetsp:Transcript_24608/g.73871  ORF Transcript_24608/g.73871 Transcript_24608/m.73871 type:complete len:215 (+) Transcript_24608:188-832(+)